jgi:hypothetical protein
MYVYCHKNPQTFQIFYIGIGENKRAWSKKRNKFWRDYVKKYGNPIIEIIHDNLTLEDVCILEIELIKKYGRRGYEEYGILVNRSLGGELKAKGSKKSEQSKILIGLKQKGILKHTEESKQRIKEQHVGRKCSEESKLKMSKPRKEGTGYNISKANKGRVSGFKNHKHTEESKLKIVNNRNNEIISLKNKIAKPNSGPIRIKIIQYDLNMNYIQEFNSITEASNILKIKYSEIYRNLQGIQKNQKFIWKFKT